MIPLWSHPKYDGVTYNAVCEFVSSRIWGTPRDFNTGTALAIAADGRVIAGVVYNNYEPDTGVIEMHAASDSRKWLTRPILLEMFDYPFNRLGCQAVVLRVDPENTRLARILKAYGFNRYDIPRLRGRDKAEAIFVLGDDEWRNNGFHRETT